MARRNLAYIHSPLASIPSLRFHSFKASKPSLQAIQLDYGSNSPSWTFGSKHPLHFFKRYPYLEQPLKWYPSLEKIPHKDIQIMISQNPSNRTLGSKIQEKLGLNDALKIYKLWNNDALKNTLPRLTYNQERFGKVKLMKQWNLEPFYGRKKPN